MFMGCLVPHATLYAVPGQSLLLLLPFLLFCLLQSLRPWSHDCGCGLKYNTSNDVKVVVCVCDGAETGMMQSSACMNTGAAC